jgi:hypothetical protein
MSAEAINALRLVVLTALIVFAGVLGVSEAARAAAGGPGWEITSNAYPTNFSPQPPVPSSVSGTLMINAFNIGAKGAGCTSRSGSREQGMAEALNDVYLMQCANSSEGNPVTNPITVTDVLPAGVRAVEAGDALNLGAGGTKLTSFGVPTIGHLFWACAGNGGGATPGIAGASVVTCTNREGEGPGELGVFDGGGGAPYYDSPGLSEAGHIPQPMVAIAVDVQPGANAHETNRVSIAGGGAPTPASASNPVTVSSSEPPFEVTGWDGWFSNADGTLDTLAGSHPYEAQFDFDLATIFNQSRASGEVAGGELRTAEVQLPPGFVGNPTAIPQCPRELFEAEHCPLQADIGTVTAYFTGVAPVGIQLFNLVPPPGVPAEFGFSLQGLNTYLDAGVRSGGDYGISEHVSDVAQKAITQVVTTIWGNPGDVSHDRWRDGVTGGCTLQEINDFQAYGQYCAPITGTGQPFLTLPTSCGERLPFTFKATSWTGAKSERTFYMHDSNGNVTGLSGCRGLGFEPALSISPDTANADTPAGLTVDVKPPLGGLESLEGFSTADIKDTAVTLPEGLVINPGQAAGLQACQPSQDGLTTEAEKEVGEENNGPPSCPNAAKVGTVKARTPLLEGSAEKELEGSVYVLQSNPPDLKLLAAFSADGVYIKLVLDVELDEQTGQITTRVVNVPALPVSDFKLSFSGGPQAALDTPAQCGTYLATSDFTPWSSPFTSDLTPTAAFGITAGPGSSPCPSNPMPFSPELIAGSTTDQAGGYTGFSMLLRRGDGQQRIEKLQFKVPQGLAGMISHVPLCGEPQAAQGTCSSASQIGHATVASGPGPYPLVVPQPGEPEAPIYLTGPYHGAPFGLSIVTPVIAGPFNLGTIVTRAKIEVDPKTAQITVTTDALPQIVKGVPTDLRVVDAVIDRPGFMFNPTNCSPLSFSGIATSSQGAQAQISSHFQVGSCQSLTFKPDFKVYTSGHPTRADGASLTAKIVYPTGPLGQDQATSQANIASVKVSLPKELPSQLKTLQKACLASVFDANPANCPAASVVGHATAITPVLPVPLSGPAYFVSHGGEAFPSLIVVLQGDNVTVDLEGSTFISKQGITSSTFKQVPDVPVSTFELILPQGPHAALTAVLPAKAHGSLCGRTLDMPTIFVGQNGAEVHQTTKITPTGCGKNKAKAKKKRKAARRKPQRRPTAHKYAKHRG